jgi:hypothetical protein
MYSLTSATCQSSGAKQPFFIKKLKSETHSFSSGKEI